ncbi:uncharacterized membrane protein YuzA (DUF378 family) [Bradyrhizobium sp. LA8.1]|uniref:hypothetical protein n=1 Tax=unclassified Bradyrhizobium TaxID=2631580 RepID=UPI003390E399
MTLFIWFDPAAWLVSALDAINSFSAEVFWQIATSPLVLVVIAAVVVASFALAHLPFVTLLFPKAAAFTKAASLVTIIGFAALLYLFGVKSERTRAELERVKSDLAFKEFQLGNQAKAAADAEDLKADADAQAQDARGKLSVYQAKFGDDPNAAACAPRAGVIDWLHDLQRRKQAAGAVAGKPKRGLVARLRRSGAERR